MLHRKLLDSAIITSDKGFRLWVWCLLKANHEEADVYLGTHKIHLLPGQFVFGRESASESLKLSPSTVRNWMEILKQDNKIDIRTTNKYSVITICNWKDYQTKDNEMDNKITTEKKENNTNNNDKNEKNILETSSNRSKTDDVVDFVLSEFKKRYGFQPIDKKPRQVAYNIKQITNTFIKHHGLEYEAQKKEKPDTKIIISRVFDKFIEQEYAKNTQYLDTFKRHLKKILEITADKLQAKSI